MLNKLLCGTTLLVLLFMPAMPVRAQGTHPAQYLFTKYSPAFQKLSQSSWAANGQNVAANTFSNDEIARFLDVLEAKAGTVPQTVQDYPYPSAFYKWMVREFRFVDLNNDGQLELVVSAVNSGANPRLFVVSFAGQTAKFKTEELYAANVFALSQAIQDVDGDGRQELVLDQQMTSGRSGRLQVTYTGVFSFDRTSATYKLDSKSYAAYYKAVVLPAVDKRLNALIQAKASADRVLVVQIERDKILRLTGIALAGDYVAHNLATDPVFEKRLLAVAILRDIGVATGNLPAVVTLNILVRDVSTEVSADAQAAIQEISKFWP